MPKFTGPAAKCRTSQGSRSTAITRLWNRGDSLVLLELDVGEDRCLQNICIMRAHRQAHINRILQHHRCWADGFQFFARVAGIYRELTPAAFDADAYRADDRGSNLLSVGVRGAAELQGSESITVERDIGISSIGVEALANHERRFAVFDRAGADEAHVNGQRHVAREALPNEVKGVGRLPHVGAAAGNAEFA